MEHNDKILKVIKLDIEKVYNEDSTDKYKKFENYILIYVYVMLHNKCNKYKQKYIKYKQKYNKFKKI